MAFSEILVLLLLRLPLGGKEKQLLCDRPLGRQKHHANEQDCY
jgi:hypothetical protein